MPPTEDQLRRLFPHARAGYFEALAHIAPLLERNGLAAPLPLCHFLAQAAHETGEFKIVEESGNYSAERLREVWPGRFTPAQARAYAHKPAAILSRAYARAELGNGLEATGDGFRYRGRGPFQTTGKFNYGKVSRLVGFDLVADPDRLAEDFDLGWKAALLEWSALDLGAVALRLGATHAAVLAIARGINTGSTTSRTQPNGLADRKAMFGRLWAEFGKDSPIIARLDPAADGILEAGEEGEAVKALQRQLAALGYPVGVADGVFGERTEAAVAAFQMREALAGAPGKWRIADYGPRLAAAFMPSQATPPAPAAVPFADAARQEITAAPPAAAVPAYPAPPMPAAVPFADAPRQDATATTLAAKGDRAVSALGWMRTGAAGVAAFLGLDTAADKAGLQLPQTLSGLRQAIDPLAGELQWLLANKWTLGIAAAVGVWALSGWITGQLVARYRGFGMGGTA